MQWLIKMSLHCIYANLFMLLGGTTIGWLFALKSDKQVAPLGGGLCSNFGARREHGVLKNILGSEFVCKFNWCLFLKIHAIYI
jgi:hypothetical protein